VQNTLAAPQVVSADEGRVLWHQWYFNTERGRVGLEQHRRAICRLLWQEWSPTWRFDYATFECTAASFDNPDFGPVVIHSYRHRHGNAPSDPRFDQAERHLATRPPITVPTIVLHGAEDAVSPPNRSAGPKAELSGEGRLSSQTP
jgi:pimeloyl-ACP methyl ester carboxylesterase